MKPDDDTIYFVHDGVTYAIIDVCKTLRDALNIANATKEEFFGCSCVIKTAPPMGVTIYHERTDV